MATSRLSTRRVEWRVQVGTSNKPGQGLVIFEASVSYIPDPLAAGGPRTAIPEPVAAVLDAGGYACTPDPTNPARAGERGVDLFTTDSLGADGGDWTWTARPQLRSVNGIQMTNAVPAFSFAVPTGTGSLDLAEVQKVPASPGLGTEQAVALVARAEKALRDAVTIVGDTVKEAAEIAVDTALEGSGLVSGAVRTEPNAATQEYQGGFIGENGRPTDLVFDSKGAVVQDSIDTWAGRMAPMIGIEKASGFSSDAAGGLVGENGRETDIVFDSAGRIVQRTIGDWAGRMAPFLSDKLTVKPVPKAEAFLGAQRNLMVRDGAGNIRRQTSSPDKFAAWGDSLTAGYPKPPFSTDQSDSWPGVLAAISGKTVYNGGKSGQSADEIAIRAGGLILMLKPEGGSIPVSGVVTVTTTQRVAWREDREWEDTGTLSGVPGKLSRAAGSTVLKFTRLAAGTATPVSNEAPFLPSAGLEHADATAILMIGRNDIGYNVPSAGIVERIVNANVAIIESLRPTHPRFLILGTLNSVYEHTGTAGWTEVTESGRILSEMYPDNAFDMRSYVVKQSIYDQGLTPTAADLSNMARDCPPPQIMVDGVHYTPDTAATVAAKAYSTLKLKGMAA